MSKYPDYKRVWKGKVCGCGKPAIKIRDASPCCADCDATQTRNERCKESRYRRGVSLEEMGRRRVQLAQEPYACHVRL